MFNSFTFLMEYEDQTLNWLSSICIRSNAVDTFLGVPREVNKDPEETQEEKWELKL